MMMHIESELLMFVPLLNVELENEMLLLTVEWITVMVLSKQGFYRDAFFLLIFHFIIDIITL